jgi:hypothetical protein
MNAHDVHACETHAREMHAMRYTLISICQQPLEG